MAEAEGVELLGEGLAKDAVREAYAGEISGNLALEVDPEVWVVVLRFAADEMEDGHAVVGRAEKKRRAEVGEQRKVEGGRRGASEADGAAGVGGERPALPTSRASRTTTAAMTTAAAAAAATTTMTTTN